MFGGWGKGGGARGRGEGMVHLCLQIDQERGIPTELFHHHGQVAQNVVFSDTDVAKHLMGGKMNITRIFCLSLSLCPCAFMCSVQKS